MVFSLVTQLLRQVTGNRTWFLTACLVVWGMGIYATLSLAHAQTQWSGALCGPWGCTAPLEALLACHAAWLITLTPLVLAAASHGQQTLQRIVWLLAAIGFGGVAVLSLQELESVNWQLHEPYLWKKIGLSLLETIDFPILPSIVMTTFLLLMLVLRKVCLRHAIPQ